MTALVPLLLTGVRLHPPGRTDKNLCRCFGAPARWVFPDHLIRSLFSREACIDYICFLVLVCVGTQCVPSVAARVVAKIYRPFFYILAKVVY